MCKAHFAQGDPVQEGQGLEDGPGKEALRPKAAWLWRSNKADFQKEGEDDEEDRVAYGMLRVQAPQPVGIEEV